MVTSFCGDNTRTFSIPDLVLSLADLCTEKSVRRKRRKMWAFVRKC